MGGHLLFTETRLLVIENNKQQLVELLSQTLQVPYRCLYADLTEAIPCMDWAGGQKYAIPYVIDSFRGPVMPGAFPTNSRLWKSHCSICDDRLLQKGERAECTECYMDDICINCVYGHRVLNGQRHLNVCWLCVSSVEGWIPTTIREQKLQEVYEEENKYITEQLSEKEYVTLMNEFIAGDDKYPLEEVD